MNILMFLFIFFTITSLAKPTGYQVIDPDRIILNEIKNKKLKFNIDHVSKLGFEIYGNESVKLFLDKKNAHYFLLKSPNNKSLAGYPSPEQIVLQLKSLEKKYPKLMTLIEIGKSVEGRPLLFAKLTAPKALHTLEPNLRPEFKYVANMHGDEIVGRELMVRLIEDLLISYGVDPTVTQVLDTTQVYIMPSMNPDGAFATSRENANGVDLNRAFPDFTTRDNTNTPNSREPEIQAMMKFQAKHQFLLSANFHGGAVVVNYPYDTTSSVFPKDNLIKNISLNYTKLAPYFWNSTEFERGVVRGYDWYPVDGGMQDWSYHWHGDLQVTIELSDEKWPTYSSIGLFYQQNRASLLKYISDIHQL